jgi:hypothetical protein
VPAAPSALGEKNKLVWSGRLAPAKKVRHAPDPAARLPRNGGWAFDRPDFDFADAVFARTPTVRRLRGEGCVGN